MTARRLLPALALALSACAPTTPDAGFVNAHAYYRSHEHWRVRLDGGHLVSPGWAQVAGPDAPAYVERDLVRYFPRVWGRMRVARWDLRFEHRDTGGAIWARTLPLAPLWARDPLDVMLERAVLSAITPNAVAPDLLGRDVAALGVAIRAAGPARVDGREARFITWDLTERGADGDGLVTERITVVAVPLDRPWRHRAWTLPAVVLFAHASAPEAHAAQRADFGRFVSRVDLAPAGE